MKTIDTGMRTMLTSRVWTHAWGMKLVRSGDGDVAGFTSMDREATVTVQGSPLLLTPTNGVDLSSIARNAGFGVDNLEITVVQFDDYMTKVDLLDGFWDNSAFLLFQYDWATPANAIIPWLAGTFGNIKPALGTVKIELRCLRQALQQDTTRVTQANCDAEFGGDRCHIDLAPYTWAGTVTTAGQRTFTASAIGAAAGAGDEGKITWITGVNAGRVRKVREHASGGVFTLWDPMRLPVDIGDTFTLVEGCPKTRAACIARGNIEWFQGFDQKPTTDYLTDGAVP